MASGASRGAKKIKPFDEQNTKLAQGSKVPSIPITEHDVNYGTKAGKEWQKGDSPYYLKPTGLPLKKA